MLNMLHRTVEAETKISNDNYCAAAIPVSACGRQASQESWGEDGGCVFKVGDDMYFVPTRQMADEDMLYITCDAQKIETPMDGWRLHLSLGAGADGAVEDAILDHLHSSHRTKPQGDAFVITRDGKTFRL